jgi:hypothetical protein
MTAGFQKPVSAKEFKHVGLARITSAGDTSQCSCGWGYKHDREKVREDAVDKHLDKYHGGRGIRL